MLIEFSVENFRSFRERQTFSMVATPKLHKRANTFSPDTIGEKLPPLLKVAAIYGPNASGKSNLVRAIAALQKMARSKPVVDPLDKLPISPFRFDPLLLDQPSRFEVHFVADGVRYQFELSATPDRIMEERLYAFPKGKESLLYEREYSSGKETYVFGQLEGGKEVHEAWRKLTSAKMLFISQAVANSSEELTQLRPPLEWLRSGLSIVESPEMMRELANATRTVAVKIPSIIEDISQFLSNNDIPVTTITFPEEDSSKDLIDDEVSADLYLKAAKKKMLLTHKTKLGAADFNFSEESDGTKNLIGFWLPWSLHAKHKYSKCLVVDELDSSLHPRIVTKLIESHIKSDLLTQLIFTTHDTHLMDSKLLRRDQFWITERDENGATQLRSIYEFEGREGEDIEKRYFEGRYRGLPILKEV